ncbi:MAG: ABC transporter ATP-binding protein [bacterium]|nr:ABC transporter ATP-binding protein [bacterium]
MPEKIVTIENLKAYYLMESYGINRRVYAVDEVSFEIFKGEILGIAGESGCGKTTLTKTLLGIIKPPLYIMGGEIRYKTLDGEINILALQEEEIKKLRWKVMSYIPQGSMSVLNPLRKIKDTFQDFVEAHQPEMDKITFNNIIREHLVSLGLPLEVLNLYPHQLSGGMRQRVTIALSTIFKPEVIFADEPTTALDVVVQRGVLQLLQKIQKQAGNTLVIIGHDMSIHARITNRIAIMYAGKIIEIGETKDIYNNPLHPYTRYLIGSLPRIGDKSYKTSIPGTPPSLANPPTGCRFHPRCPDIIDICSKEEPPLVEIKNGHKVACFRVSDGGQDNE